MIKFLALVVSIYAIYQFENAFSLESEVIDTTSGPLKGFITENSKQYLGIPYATAKRFEPPTESPKWSSTLDATKVGPMCYQDCPSSPPHLCLKQMTEDCLTLNVWVPRGEPEGSGFAVMVFVHGGNYVAYSGGSPLFDGNVFVKKGGVILVTLNYRLGVFGFLSRIVDGKFVSGNNGLLDQEIAIKWIYNNIHAFGGDRNKITLFGQSAGAQSIAVHLTTKKVTPYFKRAIIQSSPLTLPFRNLTEAKKQMELFLRQLGCKVDDAACLETKSSDEILQAQVATPQNGFSDLLLMQFEAWGPVIDGNYITGNLMDMMENVSLDKDVIIGTVSGEGIPYIYSLITYSVPEYLFTLSLAMVIPGSSQIAQQYVVDKDSRGALSEVATDFVFYCPSRRFADLLSQSGNVWFYLFDQPLSIDAWGNHSHCVNEACHSVDMPFLFDTPYLVGYNVTSDDEKLSSTMIGYWASFAKYGNPNQGNELPEWPEYNTRSGNPKNVIFTEPNVVVGEVDRNVKCNALEKQGYKLNG